jgi:hypothetical protein
MEHAQGQRQCLLCHLSIQSDELVLAGMSPSRCLTQLLTALAFGGDVRTQQHIFRACKDFLCQKSPCFRCMTGPPVVFIHWDCFCYLRHFHSETAIQLRDIVASWPRAPYTSSLSSKHDRAREKESFVYYFGHLIDTVGSSQSTVSNPEAEVMRLLVSIAKLPQELRSNIAKLSWPCALQQPSVIVAEATKLVERFLKGNKSNNLGYLKYTGEHVAIQRLTLFGRSYVTGLDIDCQQPCRRGILRPIAITRDEVGIIDINFCGDFERLRRGYWYRILRPKTECIDLHIHSEVETLIFVRLTH